MCFFSPKLMLIWFVNCKEENYLLVFHFFSLMALNFKSLWMKQNINLCRKRLVIHCVKTSMGKEAVELQETYWYFILICLVYIKFICSSKLPNWKSNMQIPETLVSNLQTSRRQMVSLEDGVPKPMPPSYQRLLKFFGGRNKVVKEKGERGRCLSLPPIKFLTPL